MSNKGPKLSTGCPATEGYASNMMLSAADQGDFLPTSCLSLYPYKVKEPDGLEGDIRSGNTLQHSLYSLYNELW